MTTTLRALSLCLTAAVTAVLLSAPGATAAGPSCVSQSVHPEHELYGTAWGHDLIAFLATHPEVLAESGFESFGDLASYAARQGHADCPADL